MNLNDKRFRIDTNMKLQLCKKCNRMKTIDKFSDGRLQCKECKSYADSFRKRKMEYTTKERIQQTIERLKNVNT